MFEFDRDKLRKAGLLAGLFLVFTLLVRFVDVRTIGPEGSSVGFAGVNGLVAGLIGGYHAFWFNIAELLGYVAILFCLFFAFKGIRQLLDAQGRLSLVDNSYFALGITYLITIAFYEIFNIIVINCRPVIVPGEDMLEASYPSSHTMLSVVVMLTSVIMFRRMFPEGDSRRKLLTTVCYAILAATVLSRFLSGAHWLTDYVGGILLSLAITGLFDAVIKPDSAASHAIRTARSGKASGSRSSSGKGKHSK